MEIAGFNQLACPLDGSALTPVATGWDCPEGHHFDRARQGHTHLLPVQNKRSRDPGDSKAMVAARQRFLNAGHYQPVAEMMSRTILDLGPDKFSLLDAGSGEGYYLRHLTAPAGPEARVKRLALAGLDISKWAALAAARQDPRPTWLVASNARIPVVTGALDWITCLFGFPVYPEFRRVLKAGGQLLEVDPGPNHLRELREIIYPTVHQAPDSSTEGAPPGFIIADTQTLQYSLSLETPDVISDLLAMTPHLYRASSEGRDRALALHNLTVTIDVRLRRCIRQTHR